MKNSNPSNQALWKTRILKIIETPEFTIYADLASSYFQIKIDRKLWKYLGVMTPYRGIRVLTRLGQGLVNSDKGLFINDVINFGGYPDPPPPPCHHVLFRLPPPFLSVNGERN